MLDLASFLLVPRLSEERGSGRCERYDARPVAGELIDPRRDGSPIMGQVPRENWRAVFHHAACLKQKLLDEVPLVLGVVHTATKDRCSQEVQTQLYGSCLVEVGAV